MIMIKILKKFFTGKIVEPSTDFSRFFYSTPSYKRKKVLKNVVREANKDQRDLVERYQLKFKNN